MEEMQFEQHGAVAVLTVNRPAQRNAMTWAMYERLVALCDVVDNSDDIRVWIIRGAGGKAFIAGTDISQFTTFQGNAQAGIDYEANIDRIVGRLAAVQKATIACIDGYALGGGLMIALNCDLRVATPESRLSIPCVKLGNCLSMANYARLIQLVGPARTLEIMYTGHLLTADEAHAFGLVNTVVPRPQVDDHVRDLAQSIAAAAPLTVQVSKEAVRRLTHTELPKGDDLIQTCYTSPDFQEGVAAFLEKRAPRWQ